MVKKIFITLFVAIVSSVCSFAHDINNCKYVVIEHQDDAAKDIEQRMQKEFPKLGFVILSTEEFDQLNDTEKAITLVAKYRCRQSGECIFKLELLNSNGIQVYEDEQIGGAGFMSRKNDRQSAIKKIFKQLAKLNYQYTPQVSDNE